MSAHLTPQSGALVHIDPKKRALVYRNTSIIDRVASSLGPAVDKLARRLGWGINNATVNVLDALIALSKNSDGKEDRELLLCKLRNASSSDDGVPQLAAACKNLMKYALRLRHKQLRRNWEHLEGL
ncbi:hypothetical protein FRC17_008184 [Serendipita sp. 399]|nr:hypothetical protein FRC17_008184 [Serendipita sp. 399]